MAEGIRNDRVASWRIAAIAVGAASASLWLSVYLAPLFLIPVQLAYGKMGRKAGLLAIAASVIVLLPFEAWRAVDAGLGLGPADLAGILAFPLACLAAMAIINARFAERLRPLYRILALGVIVGIAAAPAVAFLLSDSAFKDALTRSVSALVSRFTVDGGGISDKSYDVAASLAALDPAQLVASTLATFASCYVALICVLFGASWWVGNRLSGEGSEGRRHSPPLSELRAPDVMVWPFFASLGFLLVVLYFKAGFGFRAFAWNLVLAMSLVYTAQGMGIVSHFLRRMNVPGGFRIAFAVIAFASALLSPTGAFLLAILPLLGLTELWIPYRNPKGVGA